MLDSGLVPHLFRMMLSHDCHLDYLPIFSTLLRNVFESEDFPIQLGTDAIFIESLTKTLTSIKDETVQTNLSLVCIKLALGAKEDNVDELMQGTDLLSTLVRLQDSPIGIVSEKAIDCLETVAKLRTTFEAEGKGTLSWGEYRMLELVDSDEESLVSSYDEALEVSDEQVELEEQQALDANAPIYIYNPPIPNAGDEVQEATPTLLGIHAHLLEDILIYATETEVEVNVLGSVCKRFSNILDDGSDFNEFRARHGRYQKTTIGIRSVQKFQKNSSRNEIMEIICGDVDNDGDDQSNSLDVRKLQTFANSIISKMLHLGPGTVYYRLRRDTIVTLFELCQDYIVRRLENALLLAIHSQRTEVQKQDFILLPSQVMHSNCNVGENYHCRGNLSFACSCSLPSSSGTIWRWPENDCRDVFTSDDGRRIIRRLAYRAGIIEMTSQVFELVEVELLHTFGVLLVEAYETAVESSKSARLLDPNDEDFRDESSNSLPYGISKDSVDMFYVSPPPLSVKETGSDYHNYIHTIVPGQILQAAERRDIPIRKVYGTTFTLEDEEFDFEVGLYFKDRSVSPPTFDTSNDDEDFTDKSGRNDDRSVVVPPVADANVNVTASAAESVANVEGPVVPPAPAAAANIPQPAPARNALDALRAHRRFEELRVRYQNNFASARQMLNEIIQEHPELRDAIDNNQAAFYDMMSQ